MDNQQLQNIIIAKAKHRNLQGLQDMAKIIGRTKDEGYFEKNFEYQEKGARIIFIAGNSEDNLGYCILNWKPKYPLFKKLGIPEVQDLNVIPDARRQGIATAMIKHCETLVAAKGYEQTGIGVGIASNFGPAQRLYTKLEYIPDGNGVTYDRKPVRPGEFRAIDDNLCLMMIKELKKPVVNSCEKLF